MNSMTNSNEKQLEFLVKLTAEELAKILIGQHVPTIVKIRGTELQVYIAIK